MAPTPSVRAARGERTRRSRATGPTASSSAPTASRTSANTGTPAAASGPRLHSLLGQPDDALLGLTRPGPRSPNFPPGAAEAMYLNAHQASAAAAIIRAADVRDRHLVRHHPLRAEPHRLPRPHRRERPRRTPNQDGGFVLYDSDDPRGLRRRRRLPHINPAPRPPRHGSDERERADAAVGQPIRPGPDPGGQPGLRLLRERRRRLSRLPNLIVRGSASGDYTTSSPVSGAAVSLGNTVILTSTRYPRWQGHIRALDTTNPARHRRHVGRGRRPDETLTALASDALGITCAGRQLYTWDPSTGRADRDRKGNAAAIQGLCGVACVTPLTPAGIDATSSTSSVESTSGISFLDPVTTKIANPNKVSRAPGSWVRPST